MSPAWHARIPAAPPPGSLLLGSVAGRDALDPAARGFAQWRHRQTIKGRYGSATVPLHFNMFNETDQRLEHLPRSRPSVRNGSQAVQIVTRLRLQLIAYQACRPPGP